MENRLRRLLVGEKGASAAKRASPIPALPPQYVAFLQDTGRVVFRILQTAWCVVAPVFDAKSDVRKRWGRGRSTGRDFVLFISAAAFVGAMLILGILVLKVVMAGMQVIQLIWSVVRILSFF